MATLPTSINISAFTTLLCDDHLIKTRRTSFIRFKRLQPLICFSLSRRKFSCFHDNGLKLRALGERWSFLGEKDGILMREEDTRRGKKKRVVAVRLNQFGFNGGGGGGGGGRDNTRVLGNLALAIGLTYLSFTGQLGWLLDAIVSIWLLAVILPVAGLGVFLWWAGRDMVQSSCPNCGNEFQIFKSSLKDGMQLCPYCTQPFSGKNFNKISLLQTIYAHQQWKAMSSQGYLLNSPPISLPRLDKHSMVSLPVPRKEKLPLYQSLTSKLKLEMWSDAINAYP